MSKADFHLPYPHYFLSHSVGAQPRGWARAVEADFADPWREAGAAVWDDWFAALDRFKAGLAPLLGCAPRDIAPQTNVSSGIAKILFSLPGRARRKKIVLSEDDFPTVGFALGQARRLGYELVFLPGGERLAEPESWTPAFADDVQLVSVSHVYSNSSVCAPIEEICRRAHERGVFTLIDVAQSAGALPIGLREIGADFAVGTSQKYLCGGPGAAFLFASPEAAARAAPMDVGWFSHEEPFAFDIRDFRYAPGAARFTGGTPSFGPFAGACAGQALLNAKSVAAVREHAQTLLQRLFARLPEAAILSCRRGGARGAAALIAVQDYDRAALDLRAAGVAHDTRKGAVRVSFHLYNDETDVDALADALYPHARG